MRFESNFLFLQFMFDVLIPYILIQENKNLADPTDPDPKHCRGSYYKCLLT